MSIDPNETLIVGSWKMIGGRMIEDLELERIRSLVAGELERVTASPSGWEILYIDHGDGRYWEMFYPECELHGGGPPSLRVLDPRSAQDKYQVSSDSAARP